MLQETYVSYLLIDLLRPLHITSGSGIIAHGILRNSASGPGAPKTSSFKAWWSIAAYWILRNSPSGISAYGIFSNSASGVSTHGILRNSPSGVSGKHPQCSFSPSGVSAHGILSNSASGVSAHENLKNSRPCPRNNRARDPRKLYLRTY